MWLCSFVVIQIFKQKGDHKTVKKKTEDNSVLNCCAALGMLHLQAVRLQVRHVIHTPNTNKQIQKA